MTGTSTSNSIKIYVNSGTFSLIIRDLTIQLPSDDQVAEYKSPAIGIFGNANVNIIISGTNNIRSAYGYGGIHKENNDTSNLTITSINGDGKQDGELTVKGGYYGAGIGGGRNQHGANISIKGGTIIAIGHVDGAGIGGGTHGDGYNIVIDGGKVSTRNHYDTSNNSAGIGGGLYGNGYDITINSGDVNAISGNEAAIGGGVCKNVTINGGKISVAGLRKAAGIGGSGGAENITINGGDISINHSSGAGIGTTGYNGNNAYCKNIYINGGTVKINGNENGWGGAGIGEGGFLDGIGGGNTEHIVISGGSLYIIPYKNADCIGGGSSSVENNAILPTNGQTPVENVYLTRIMISGTNKGSITRLRATKADYYGLNDVHLLEDKTTGAGVLHLYLPKDTITDEVTCGDKIYVGSITTKEDNTAIGRMRLKTVAVTFQDWDGTVLKSETVDYGEGATAPPNPTRDGYTFTGWDVAFDNVTSNLIVTAQYVINTYNVTFKDWDGTILKSEIVDYGEGATAPSNPTRDGYIFTGWDAVFDNITSDLTVIAQYTEIPIQDIDILDEAKMLDPSNADDMERLKELESIYKDRENVTVNIVADLNTHGDFKQNIDAISVVGAAFNAKQNETITLHFSKPAKNIVIDGTRYKTNNAVQFDIRLMKGETPLQDLDVPITITVPIPSGIKENNFWILHYHNNGDYEVITPKLNGDGTCTFTVADFSVFAFVNSVEANENEGNIIDDSISNDIGTTETSTDPQGTSNTPKTGDKSNMMNWIIVAGLSVTAIIIVLLLRRKYAKDIR